MKLGKTKKKIMKMVCNGITSQRDIIRKLGISDPAVSKHINDLEHMNYLRTVVRSSSKILEPHEEYLKFKRKKVNFVSTPTDYELTKKRTEKVNLSQKKLTSKSPPPVGNELTSPMGEGERSSIHHLFIPVPLTEPKRIHETFDQTNELKNVREHYRFLNGRITIKIYENKRTSEVVSAMITVKLTDYNPKADPREEIHRIFEEAKQVGCSYLVAIGLTPDHDKISVTDLHIGRMDEVSVEVGGKLNKIIIPLGRLREKITPNDPNQEAFTSFDKTPGPADTEEGNDIRHDYLKVMMPEYVYELKQIMGSVARDTTKSFNANLVGNSLLREIRDLLGSGKVKKARKIIERPLDWWLR